MDHGKFPSLGGVAAEPPGWFSWRVREGDRPQGGESHLSLVSHFIVSATLGLMPTVLPRRTVTETLDVQQWLDDAARIWPDAGGNRNVLAKRLMEVGHDQVSGAQAQLVSRRRQAIRAASGSMPGVWPPGWYATYKDEWS